ncbi:MAG: hypothetical protein KAT68_01865 [Bacteroidales bacterium]|nr:hypothetical protein [Bacteroidales bacterium]
MATEQKSDEIDLLELFKNIGNWFVSIFNNIIRIIVYFFLIIFKKLLYLIGFVFLGCVIGYFIFFVTDDCYETEAILTTNSVSNSDLISYINKLNNNNNYLLLSTLLKLDTSITKNIKNIKASWIIDQNKDGIGNFVDYDDEMNINDTSYNRLKSRYNVRIIIYDTTIVNDVRNGLLNYINSNEYFNNVNNIKIHNYKDLIIRTEKEIFVLDSLKELNYFSNPKYTSAKNNELLFINEKTIKLFHPDLIKLIKENQNYKRYLQLYPDITTIIDDFSVPKRVTLSVFGSLIKYAIYLFIFGVVILIFIDKRKSISEIIKKYS